MTLTLPGIPFPPSEEQEAIIEEFLRGSDLVVQAGAGTGKSTVLAMLAAAKKAASPATKVRYITFNKRNAVEVSATFKSYGLTNSDVRTAHSMAWGGCKRNPALAHIVDRLGKGSMSKTAEFTYLGLNEWASTYEDKDTLHKLAKETVDNFCKSDDAEVTTSNVPWLRDYAKEDRAELLLVIADIAQRMWSDLISPEGRMYVTHGVYLKAWALTNPVIGKKGDVLLYDEAQDANSVMSKLVLDQMGHNQIVLVGDLFQQLYGFNGSKDAMQGFAATPGVVELPLSQSRRFGPIIAGFANTVLDTIDPQGEHAMRLQGIGPSESSIERMERDATPQVDAVVCATNRQVVKHVLAQAALGRRVHATIDVSDLIRLAEDADAIANGSAHQVRTPALRQFTTVALFSKWLKEPDPGDELLHSQVTLAMHYGPTTLREIAAKLVPQEHADVSVSTIHKAKGGTWDSVMVDMGDKDVNPSDIDKLRMFYVAVTRARYSLYLCNDIGESVEDD